MLKQFIHVLHMLCNSNANIFGLTIDFCTTLLFSSIDAHDKGLYDLPHQWTCNWRLVKFDCINYYHKYFTFSLSQYAYNTTHSFHFFCFSFLNQCHHDGEPFQWFNLDQQLTTHNLVTKFSLPLEGREWWNEGERSGE